MSAIPENLVRPMRPSRARSASPVLVTALLLSLAATSLAFLPVGSFQATFFWPIFFLALLVFPRSRRMDKETRYVLLGFVALILLSLALNVTGSKPTSVVLSAAMLSYGAWAARNWPWLPKKQAHKALMAVIWAYAISTLLALLLIAAQLTDTPLEYFAGYSVDPASGSIRPRALTSEPSYAAIVVCSTWLALIRIRSQSQRLRKSLVAANFLAPLMVYVFHSIYGFFLAPIVASALIKTRRKKSGIPLVLLIAPLFAGLIWSVVTFLPESRLSMIVTSVLSLDLDEWQGVDNSSFLRFGPLYSYLSTANIFSLQFWLGHGAASSTGFFGDLFGSLAGIDNDTMQLGFIPAFLYDFGALPSLAFLALAWNFCQGPHRTQAIFVVLMMLFNANFNVQLFWYVLTCMLISKMPEQPLPSSAK